MTASGRKAGHAGEHGKCLASRGRPSFDTVYRETLGVVLLHLGISVMHFDASGI